MIDRRVVLTRFVRYRRTRAGQLTCCELGVDAPSCGVRGLAMPNVNECTIDERANVAQNIGLLAVARARAGLAPATRVTLASSRFDELVAHMGALVEESEGDRFVKLTTEAGAVEVYSSELVDPDKILIDAVAESVTYLVSSTFGPVAAGPKEKCLAYIADRLSSQSEMDGLINPSSYRLVKVTSL